MKNDARHSVTGEFGDKRVRPAAGAGWIGRNPIGGALGALALGGLVSIFEPTAAMAVLVPVVVAARGGAHAAGRRRGARNVHTVLILGRNRRTRTYLQEMKADEHSRVAVVGALDNPCAENEDQREALVEEYDVPDLGQLGDLERALRENAIDEVLITLPIKSNYDEIQEAMKICEVAGVPVSLSTDLFERAIAQPRRGATSWGGQSHRITYSSGPHCRLRLAVKRLIDIVGSAAALLLLSVPMLLIALLVKLTSRGPVLFSQPRAGINHKPFRMLKFRTMVADAEKIREEIADLNEQEGPVFKIKNDPRITPIGRFLRKFSLDELPQLFNVLRGEMSLVGPRPPIIAEVEDYQWWQRRRLSMKPGITCIWQVSGRNRIGFDDWMKLDLEYIDRWSLWLDLKLLVKTLPAVIRGSGS